MEIDALALAYRDGRRKVLAELHAALRPAIGAALRRVAARGVRGPLDLGDLSQQSWVILADLARRWRPERGAFAAYVASSLTGALQRYARQAGSGRRAARVLVVNLGEEELANALEQQVGEDGRSWDQRLILEELLAGLSERERLAFRARAGERKSFETLSAELGLTRRATRRLFARARAALRVEVRASKVDGNGAGSAAALEPGTSNLEPDVARLVRALHEGASSGGLLPGRGWVLARTGLSQGRYAELMQRLALAGCVRDRSARCPGWLVERDPEATLQRCGLEVGG